MRRFKNGWILFLLLYTFFWAVGNADALTMTVTPTLAAPSSNPYNMLPSGDFLDVTVPYFNPSLGTLQSVSIEAAYAAFVGWGWHTVDSNGFVTGQIEVTYGLVERRVVASGNQNGGFMRKFKYLIQTPHISLTFSDPNK